MASSTIKQQRVLEELAGRPETMPIETICSGCGRMLRVDDQHAGKRARCPVCQSIYTIPWPSDASTAPAADRMPSRQGPTNSPHDGWLLQVAGGELYGPVPRRELDQWCREGRIDARCNIRHGSQGNWVPATDVYPQLSQTPLAASLPPVPRAPVGGGRPVGDHSFYVPHRGNMILAFGALSWFTSCPIFGLLGWIMSSQDLLEIRSGRMDPAGESLTRAGRTLSIAHLFLVLIVAVFGILMLLS